MVLLWLLQEPRLHLYIINILFKKNPFQDKVVDNLTDSQVLCKSVTIIKIRVLALIGSQY